MSITFSPRIAERHVNPWPMALALGMAVRRLKSTQATSLFETDSQFGH